MKISTPFALIGYGLAVLIVIFSSGLGSFLALCLLVLLLQAPPLVGRDHDQFLDREQKSKMALQKSHLFSLFALVFLLITGLGISFLAKWNPTLPWLRLIGKVWEWMEMGFLLGTGAILTVYLLFNLRTFQSKWAYPILIGAILVCAFGALEESSWRPEDPELEEFMGSFLRGLALIYGICIPFIAYDNDRIRAYAQSIRMPIIPLHFMPFVVIAALLLLPEISAWWRAPVSNYWELSEAGEALFYGVLLFTVLLETALWRENVKLICKNFKCL